MLKLIFLIKKFCIGMNRQKNDKKIFIFLVSLNEPPTIGYDTYDRMDRIESHDGVHNTNDDDRSCTSTCMIALRYHDNLLGRLPWYHDITLMIDMN